MASDQPGENKMDRIIAEQRQYMVQREKGYRERALKLYPWICGRCRREFTRQNLRELTVHHINHDHGYNPSDGSNWELLCVYCHDEEHSKFESFVRHGSRSESRQDAPATFNPFADLKDVMKVKKPNDDA